MSKAERERTKAIDKNLRKVAKAVMPKPKETCLVCGGPEPCSHDFNHENKITGTTIGLVTVPELHAVRTAVLLNQNISTHTRESLSVLRSVLGKINDALRHCGEDISDISVRTEVFRSTGGENMQTLPVDQQVEGLQPYTNVPPQPPLDLEKDKKFPNQVFAENKKEAAGQKQERLGTKSKKKVRDDWD